MGLCPIVSIIILHLCSVSSLQNTFTFFVSFDLFDSPVRVDVSTPVFLWKHKRIREGTSQTYTDDKINMEPGLRIRSPHCSLRATQLLL